MNTYSRSQGRHRRGDGLRGVELLRRLARHPDADVRLAMGSSASEAKRVPALKRIWDAPIEKLRRRSSGGRNRCGLPRRAGYRCRRKSAPALARRGRRVFDISGAFRLRSEAERQRWYPHSPNPGVAVDVRLDGALPQRARHRASLIACAGCYPTAAHPAAAAARRRPGCSSRASIIDAKSGDFWRGQDARASGRIFPRSTAAWPRTGCSRTATAPKLSRSSAST